MPRALLAHSAPHIHNWSIPCVIVSHRDPHHKNWLYAVACRIHLHLLYFLSSMWPPLQPHRFPPFPSYICGRSAIQRIYDLGWANITRFCVYCMCSSGVAFSGLPINRLGMLSAMADNMGGKNHMTKLSASYLPLPYLATFYPTIVCLSSHGLIAYWPWK